MPAQAPGHSLEHWHQQTWTVALAQSDPAAVLWGPCSLELLQVLKYLGSLRLRVGGPICFRTGMATSWSQQYVQLLAKLHSKDESFTHLVNKCANDCCRSWKVSKMDLLP